MLPSFSVKRIFELFYFFSRRFAVLRPAFACPFGQLSLLTPTISTNPCVVSPQPPHRLWCTPSCLFLQRPGI